MLGYLEYLNVPMKIGGIIILALLIMQLIGEILEVKGVIVPEFLKIRKYFKRKKQEKTETVETLKEVKKLLNEVNLHYSADNITKRDNWMKWVNNRAIAYDDSIAGITDKLKDVIQALKDNTKMTEEMFIQSSRDRIIDFATKTCDDRVVVSREEFNRIFKVYDKYEEFLEARDLTNGEIDSAYSVIKESYENHMKNHTFLEDIRGYTAK